MQGPSSRSRTAAGVGCLTLTCRGPRTAYPRAKAKLARRRLAGYPGYHTSCNTVKHPGLDELAKSVATRPEAGLCVHLGPDPRWPGCIAVWQSGIYEMPLWTPAEVEHYLAVAAYYWDQPGAVAA